MNEDELVKEEVKKFKKAFKEMQKGNGQKKMSKYASVLPHLNLHRCSAYF